MVPSAMSLLGVKVGYVCKRVVYPEMIGYDMMVGRYLVCPFLLEFFLV